MTQGERIHLPVREMRVQCLGREDPLEKEMAAHSSILAWEIPWTEEPGGLWFMGSQQLDTHCGLSTKPLPPTVNADCK